MGEPLETRLHASAYAMGWLIRTRLSVLLPITLLLAVVPRLDTQGAELRARIFQIDPLGPEGFRIFATILGQGDVPVPFEDVTSLEVFRLSSGGEHIRLEYFTDGSPHVAKKNKAQTLSSADVPLDIVFLVSGNADRSRSDSLNRSLRDAALLMAKQLPSNSRANLIWVTDTLSIFVQDPRKSGELSKLRIAQKWCDEKDKSFYDSLAEHGSIVSEHPCGLLSDRSGIETALKSNSASTAFDGFYPVLFGLPWRLCAATAGEPHELQDLVGQGRDEYILQQLHTGALDKAISLLIQYGRPEALHVIMALVDGKDGYLLSADECRPVVADTCKKQHADEDPEECAQKLIRKRLFGPQQMDFLEKAQKALPLMRAARIRLDTILLPSALPHEAERMRLLSIKSGGTARITTTEQEVIPAAEAAINELTGAYVLEIYPDDEAMEEGADDAALLLGFRAELLNARRERVHVEVPSVTFRRNDRSGGQGFYSRARHWLGEKVGLSRADMILRGILIVLALLVLGLVLKMARKVFSALRG